LINKSENYVVTIKLILAGDENLTPNQNIEIFSDQISKNYTTVHFNFLMRGLWDLCAHTPNQLIQPATHHHRGMLKEHLYKILACPCNRRKQFKRQRDQNVPITTYGTTATSVERNLVNDPY
jgi:hypothetical protein